MKKNILNKFEVEKMIDNGATLVFIAEKLGIKYTTLIKRCQTQNIRTKRIKTNA
ncbi:TPA: hypothetical protein L0X66_001787 [Citrobacter freundii]|nr:hypothetical protein [Citrobacter freundii]